MPGAEAERLVIGMGRAGQDLDESTLGLGPFGLVKPERVLVFLVEADRPLGAVDLVGVAHLAPRRDAREIHLPHRAVGEAAHHLCVIVIRYCATRPLRMYGLDLGNDVPLGYRVTGRDAPLRQRTRRHIGA